MKQIFSIFFALLFIVTPCVVVADSPGANVEFVKNKAAQLCCNLTNNAPGQSAANMEYLLKTIDICNAGATNYGITPQATGQWASTDAVVQAFNTMEIPDNETSYIKIYRNRQFNTGVLINAGSKVEVKFSFDLPDGVTLFYAMCGTDRYGFLQTSAKWRSDYGSSMMFLIPGDLNNIHTVIRQGRNLWLDGVLYQNPDAPGFNCDAPLFLGANNCADNQYSFFGKIYYVKVSDINDVLVSHLVPIRTGYTMGTQTATANGFYDIIRDVIVYECQNEIVGWGCS